MTVPETHELAVPSKDAAASDPPAKVPGDQAASSKRVISRRAFLIGANVALGGGLGARLVWRHEEGFCRASVAVVEASHYDVSLEGRIRAALRELGIGPRWVRHKSVLLKPNLVEPDQHAPHANTHPALVRAVAELFRRWDAREVFVAEAEAHCRDGNLTLAVSGMGRVLHEDRIPFVDLNYDDVFRAENRLGFARLPYFYLPQSLRRADLIVSLPKMKTHHWAGTTLSMKNLFGVLPGICYGWPKNVLHLAGIHQSIVDITAVVRPHLAIVDGIIGMEGDGPLMGKPKPSHVLVVGTNLPAVDATAARLMGFDPWRIPYLRLASGRLGPIKESHIEQRGERIADLAQRFELVDHPIMHQYRDEPC